MSLTRFIKAKTLLPKVKLTYHSDKRMHFEIGKEKITFDFAKEEETCTCSWESTYGLNKRFPCCHRIACYLYISRMVTPKAFAR